MNKGLMRLWAVGLLGLVVGVGAEASSRGQVVGQVRLESGLPVVGAQVLVFDVRDLRRGVLAAGTTEGVLAAGTTDEVGEFALAWGFDKTSASSVESLSRTGLGQAQTPVGFRLGPNYPNPFNPSTVIPYELASGGYVRLEVFNLLGQRVAMLVDGEQQAGAHTAVWTGTDGVGRAVSAAVYLYRLTVASTGSAYEASQVGRMVLVDGGAGLGRLSSRGDGGSLRAELVEARPEAGDASYGLVVLGEGLVPYLDADFRLGSGPVEIEMAAVDLGRAKAVQTEEQPLLGDVDRDGQITFFDAVLVMWYVFNPSVPLPVESQISLGDVDADGRITVSDAWLIATYLTDPSDPVLAGAVGIGQPEPPTEPGELVTGTVRAFSLPVEEEYDPISMEFVWIGPGVFRMGSNSGYSDERPVHEVEISKGFWLGKYEVMQVEWEAVMGHNPSAPRRHRRPVNPVNMVTWYDVQAFIDKLNAAGSVVYRLPTEAEWEYACRAGGKTHWSLGDEDGNDEHLLLKYAWYYNDNGKDGLHIKAVGGKLPNAWGLYDMHGNVREWVQDWWDEDYYNSSPRVDPPGPTSGSYRVFRGGGWSEDAWDVRSANRLPSTLDISSSDNGVRLVRIR